MDIFKEGGEKIMKIGSGQVKTKDLWESAFLMCEGGEVEDVSIDTRRGRREVTFTLSGWGIDEHAKEYEVGRAICNVVKFRACMNHLKDVIFRRVKR